MDSCERRVEEGKFQSVLKYHTESFLEVIAVERIGDAYDVGENVVEQNSE